MQERDKQELIRLLNYYGATEVLTETAHYIHDGLIKWKLSAQEVTRAKIAYIHDFSVAVRKETKS